MVYFQSGKWNFDCSRIREAGLTTAFNMQMGVLSIPRRLGGQPIWLLAADLTMQLNTQAFEGGCAGSQLNQGGNVFSAQEVLESFSFLLDLKFNNSIIQQFNNPTSTSIDGFDLWNFLADLKFNYSIIQEFEISTTRHQHGLVFWIVEFPAAPEIQ